MQPVRSSRCPTAHENIVMDLSFPSNPSSLFRALRVTAQCTGIRPFPEAFALARVIPVPPAYSFHKPCPERLKCQFHFKPSQDAGKH